MDPSVGHLNGILARVGGNLNDNLQESQMTGGCQGGMLKLRFGQYTINSASFINCQKSIPLCMLLYCDSFS